MKELTGWRDWDSMGRVGDSIMEKRDPEKLFNIIFDSIADGVFTTDAEGSITFFNRGFTDHPEKVKRALK